VHRTAVHPFREVALVPAPTVPPAPRPVGGLTIAAMAVAGAAISAVTGAPVVLLLALMSALSVKAVINGRQRRRAHAIVRGLPFPVHGVDPDASARAIRSLTLTLADGEYVVIDDWTWGDQDVVLLAHVLSTLGVELHTRRGVARADVRWGPGGPVPTL